MPRAISPGQPVIVPGEGLVFSEPPVFLGKFCSWLVASRSSARKDQTLRKHEHRAGGIGLELSTDTSGQSCVQSLMTPGEKLAFPTRTAQSIALFGFWCTALGRATGKVVSSPRELCSV